MGGNGDETVPSEIAIVPSQERGKKEVGGLYSPSKITDITKQEGIVPMGDKI